MITPITMPLIPTTDNGGVVPPWFGDGDWKYLPICPIAYLPPDDMPPKDSTEDSKQ